MLNEDVVSNFLACYQKHDFVGMQSCLDENVAFSDYVFDIKGKEVKAMWHWFCTRTPKPEMCLSLKLIYLKMMLFLFQQNIGLNIWLSLFWETS